jgi:hypothetical protein
MFTRNRKAGESGKIAYPILSIGAVLVCSAVVFAQGGGPRLEQRVAALEAQVANLQDPLARVLIAGDNDGAQSVSTFEFNQIETNSMGSYLSVSGDEVTISKAGVYRLNARANGVGPETLVQIVVNASVVDYQVGYDNQFGYQGAYSGRLVRLNTGDTLKFYLGGVSPCGANLDRNRVEIQYEGS